MENINDLRRRTAPSSGLRPLSAAKTKPLMKTTILTRAACLAPLAFAIAPLIATAGTDAKEVIPEVTPAPVSPWEFRLTPYGWLTGLDGTSGAGGLTTDVDAPFFNDILDNMKMAAALNFEARNGKWGIIVDGFYADLGASGNPPGPLYKSASVDLKQFIGQAEVAYRVYESPKGFVDVFVGARYNALWMDLGAVIDPAGVTTVTTNVSNSITSAVETEAQAIVEPRIQEYQSAALAEKLVIEDEIHDTITSEAGAKVKEDIRRELVDIRHKNGLGPDTIILEQISHAVKKETVALAEATAKLKVAELRASVNPVFQGQVDKAQKQVDKANKELASALDTQVSDRLPTSTSDSKQWVDPIIGARAQYNFNDRWFVAGNADIGGFGVSSDITWSLEATVGYNFTQKISAELGYRYMYTDYSDGGFVYDMAQAGIYTGVNIRF